MKYLLHCILRDRPAPGVWLLRHGSLAAAVSCWESGGAAPDAARLLAYERGIARLHASGAVIPLRYGCVLEEEAQARRLLEERRGEYEALLDSLEDRDEFGLRVFFEEPARDGDLPPAATPGAAYLAELRRRRASPADLNEPERAWAGKICGALAGLYAKERREARSTPAGRVVSLYFLTARADGRRLRAGLRRIAAREGRRFLVSGPWPPYNFVTPGGPGAGGSASA